MLLVAVSTSAMVLRSPPPADTLRTSTPLLLAKSKKGGKKASSKPSKPAVRGFGMSPEQAQLKELEKSVQLLLKESGGNVHIAHEAHFAAGIERLRTDDPERWSAMMDNNTTGVGREALMELQWDTLSAFAAYGEDTLRGQKAKLRAIATASCAGLAEAATILDVGCGDGLMVPFLQEVGATMDGSSYLGVDLSGNMIARARAVHPKVRFEAASFLSAPTCAPPNAYDCVLLAACAHLFEDPLVMLQRAAACTAPGGRIVIAHCDRRRFLEPGAWKEGHEQLEAMCADLALEVKSKFDGTTAAGSADSSAELGPALEGLYLVVLERSVTDPEA